MGGCPITLLPFQRHQAAAVQKAMDHHALAQHVCQFKCTRSLSTRVSNHLLGITVSYTHITSNKAALDLPTTLFHQHREERPTSFLNIPLCSEHSDAHILECKNLVGISTVLPIVFLRLWFMEFQLFFLKSTLGPKTTFCLKAIATTSDYKILLWNLKAENSFLPHHYSVSSKCRETSWLPEGRKMEAGRKFWFKNW